MANDNRSMLIVLGVAAILVMSSVVGVAFILNAPNEDKAVFFSGDASFEVASESKQTALIYHYNGNSGTYEIPAEVESKGKTYKVVGIADNAFKNKSRLTTVTQEGYGSLTISNYAFEGCSNLRSIDLTNVVSIGDNAFYLCTSLEDVNSDLSDVKTIGDRAFYGCGLLSSDLDLSSVVSIGAHAFDNCHSLTNVTISDSITVIREGAFFYCNNLEALPLNDNIVTIESYAFAHCEKATMSTNGEDGYVEFASSLKSIGSNAFERCLAAYNFVFNNGSSKLSIGTNAFKDCGVIDEITLASNLSSIGSGAFSDCVISEIAIPSGVISIASDAFGQVFVDADGASMAVNASNLAGNSFVKNDDGALALSA